MMNSYDPSFPIFSIVREGFEQMAARRSEAVPPEASVKTQIALMGKDISYIQRDLHDVKGDIKDLRGDMKDIRQDMKDIRQDMRSDFRLLFGALITGICGLGGLLGGAMARGFGWF